MLNTKYFLAATGIFLHFSHLEAQIFTDHSDGVFASKVIELKPEITYDSHDMNFHLIFHDGNLVLRFRDVDIGNTSTKTLGGKRCLFKPQSGLVILDDNGKVIWQPVPDIQAPNQYVVTIDIGTLTISKEVMGSAPQYLPLWPQPVWHFYTTFVIPNLAYDKSCGYRGRGKVVYINNFNGSVIFSVSVKETVNGKSSILPSIIIGPRSTITVPNGCTVGASGPASRGTDPKTYEIVNYKIMN